MFVATEYRIIRRAYCSKINTRCFGCFFGVIVLVDSKDVLFLVDVCVDSADDALCNPRKIFVGNISVRTSSKDLQGLFAKIG